MLAAYAGDAVGVERLLRENRDVGYVQAMDRRGMTALHYALEGRNNGLQRQSETMDGYHEEVAELLTADPKYNNSLQCPIYYAIHYRNIRVLESIIQHTPANSVLNCVLQKDTHGYSAVHVAARSKASGFARFFLRLFHTTRQSIRSPRNPEILHLLGLQLPKFLRDGRLTFVALNDAISADDMELLLQVGEKCGRLKELLHVQDHNGNTPLHLAVAARRLELVRLLISKGSADVVEIPNMIGYSPLRIAMTRGFTDIHKLLAETLSTNFNSNDELRQQPGYHDIRAGESEYDMTRLLTSTRRNCSTSSWEWNTINVTVPQWLYNSPCQLEIIDGDKPEVFIKEYLHKQRPVILRFLTKNCSSSHMWNKEHFLEKFGDRLVTSSTVPYGNLYGHSQQTRTTTIHQFVKWYMDPNRQESTNSHPPYIFDAKLLFTDSELHSKVELPSLFKNYSIVLQQFLMG
jgi:ankyrin repeat protein